MHPTRRLAVQSTCIRLGSRYSGFLSEQGVTCGSTMPSFKADGCPMARSLKGHANHGPVQRVPLWTNGTSQVPLWACASLGMRLYGRAPPRAVPQRASASKGECRPLWAHWRTRYICLLGCTGLRTCLSGQCLNGQECLYGQVIFVTCASAGKHQRARRYHVPIEKQPSSYG